MSKGTWKNGDLEVIKIVYKGEIIKNLETLKKIKEADRNDQVRTGK